MTWGVSGIDKEDVSMWDSEYLGEIEWDNNFNLAPENNQNYLYNLCQDLKDNSLVQD